MSISTPNRLSCIRVGDRLIGDSFGRYEKYTVARLTPTQIVCENGAKFNRKTGCLVGERPNRWGPTCVRPMDGADFFAEDREKALARLRALRFSYKNQAALDAFMAATASAETS